MNKQYAREEELGYKLAEIVPLINWEVFRPIILIPLKPCKSNHNTQNTYQKHIRLHLLHPTPIKHPQTKKNNLANANKKIGKIEKINGKIEIIQKK
jgi:hypothetical protein